MTDLNLPPGFTARLIDPQADVDAVTELCASAGMAEYGTPDITPDLVRESYNDPSFDPRTDGLLVADADGKLGAVIEYYDSQVDHVAPFVYLRVRPDLVDSGVGEPLLAWAEQRGQTTLGLAAPDLRVSLHASAAGVNEPMQRVFERAGWAQERVYWTMEIELAAEPPEVPALPAGVAIRTAVAGEDEPAIHAAEVEAFADHFGYIPRSYEEWLRFATKVFPYDPSLWFLAVEGDQVAGMALCLIEAPGRPDVGWVATLGVRPAWRGKGVGLALLKQAFAELHRLGLRKVGLGVDSQSLTGATRLYERAGMLVARDQRSYERVLRDGREIRPT